MLLRNKGFLAFLCILVVVAISLITQRSPNGKATQGQWIPSFKSKPGNPCQDKLEWLSSLSIAYPVKYAHREIIVQQRADLKRQLLTKLDEKLFPEFETIDLSGGPVVELKHCKDPLVLDVPTYSLTPVDASHIIFGMSTTLDRLRDSIPALLRWLPNTGARLYVIAVESEDFDDIEKTVPADSATMMELQTDMRALGMEVTIVQPLDKKDTFSEKYFSLVKVMYSYSNDQTQWISAIDDDTFFPSMPALVGALAKYDPKRQYYIGALSENWSSVTTYGLMAFGGAGVFLSLALAVVLDDNYETCKHTSGSSAGDVRILECIYSQTTTKLTNERDLHQVDIWGDLSGFFESGRLPLSLHHWKPGESGLGGWPVPTYHIVADVCKECFLQRWQFGTDTVLSNGFSVSVYPKGDLGRVNLEMMEDTWNPTTIVDFSVNHGTDHSLGPTRPKLILEEEKIQHRLIASTMVEGGVRQAYLHAGEGDELDSLLELFWVTGENHQGGSAGP